MPLCFAAQTETSGHGVRCSGDHAAVAMKCHVVTSMHALASVDNDDDVNASFALVVQFQALQICRAHAC